MNTCLCFAVLQVMKLLKANGASFQHEVIHRASVAGSPLAAWVKANVQVTDPRSAMSPAFCWTVISMLDDSWEHRGSLQYSVVLEKVAPLEADLAGLNKAMAEAQTRLAECESELAELDAKVKHGLSLPFGRPFDCPFNGSFICPFHCPFVVFDCPFTAPSLPFVCPLTVL